MSIFEYDEEKHIKSERKAAYRKGKQDGQEEGIKQGIEQGRKQGLKQGIEQGIEQGIRALIETTRELGNTRQETVERLMGKLQISQEKAEESMGKYWH